MKPSTTRTSSCRVASGSHYSNHCMVGGIWRHGVPAVNRTPIPKTSHSPPSTTIASNSLPWGAPEREFSEVLTPGIPGECFFLLPQNSSPEHPLFKADLGFSDCSVRTNSVPAFSERQKAGCQWGCCSSSHKIKPNPEPQTAQAKQLLNSCHKHSSP